MPETKKDVQKPVRKGQRKRPDRGVLQHGEVRWLNADEVAEFVGLHRATVYRLARESKIPMVNTTMGWRGRSDDIDRWVRAGCVQQRPKSA
jgi:excisionase family DNA binding protein